MAERNQVVWLALLMLALWVCAATSRTTTSTDDMSVRHEQWMAEHGRQYKDTAEKKYRLEIFKSNVEHIESVNRDGGRKYKLSVNKFADLTEEEFKSYYKGFKPNPTKATVAYNETLMNMSDVPPSVDWRTKGAVTGVKDQGSQCGCCWAFSAVGATEGLIQIKKGNLISLSEQQLVDCVTGGVSKGCDGGSKEEAFEFIIQNKGIAAEETYPYTAAEGTCNMYATSAATITGYEKVPANSEEALMAAVAIQPVSVTIDAGGQDFKFYSQGVFTGECGTDLDHVVTLIGYGTEESVDGTKYWLVKNSWGVNWGEGGYIKMAKDVDAPQGLCGIAMDASYPTLN